MPEWLIIISMGGVFILFGLVFGLWGKGEEKSYYNAISVRPDVREFVEHEPGRPEPGALKVGGWIAVAVGLLLLIVGGLFWLLG
ncbi:hypothetical protein ACFLYF_03000 [Chloroflexota bacterium]